MPLPSYIFLASNLNGRVLRTGSIGVIRKAIDVPRMNTRAVGAICGREGV